MMNDGSAALAINGGAPSLSVDVGSMFAWPIVTAEDESAVLEVMRRGAMSKIDVTREFERELGDWFDTEYVLCHNNGTAAIQAAMYACGVRTGDEIICQSMTFWASALQVYSLGGTIVFAEMDPTSLTLDPADIEHRITDRTRAIVVVHYCGHPTDMDPIMEIASRHGIKVIEDVSHSQGGMYKGRLLGTIGDVGAMSIMSGKSLACGEGGFLLTDDRDIFERALTFGEYTRADAVENPELQRLAGMPLGGYKYRMHQLSSAMGRVQLRHYRERMEVIQKAMAFFWERLDGVPGITAHMPPAEAGSTMGGWYSAHALYSPDELGGLPVARFCEALNAEIASGGWKLIPGGNPLMHLHPLMNDADIYGHGKPTRIAHADRDLRQPAGSLPVTESLPSRCFSIPWFKRYDPHIIEAYAAAFHKVVEHHRELF